MDDAVDTQDWTPILAEKLELAHLEAIIAGTTPYVCIPRFLALDWCAEITRRFDDFITANPQQRLKNGSSLVDTVTIPIDYFMHPVRVEEYFGRVAADDANLRELYRGGVDPLEKLRACWRSFGWTEAPASYEGKSYLTDVLWGSSNGYVPVHADSYHVDFPFGLSHYPLRLSSNIFTEVADEGGAFCIYRKKKAPGESPPFYPDPKKPRFVLNTPFVERVVQQGDLVLFDSSFYHEVRPMSGTRRRLAAHSSLGIDPASRVVSFFI